MGNQVGQNVTALKSKDSELDDRILSITQDLLSVKNETNKHLEKVLMEQVSEINEIKETSILQKDQLSNQSTRITLCEKQIKHCDDTIDHLKGNIESSEKKTADLNHSINNLEIGLSEKFKVMKDDVDKKIEKSSQLLDSQATDLEKKIKANTDNIKNLEDSLDGLRSTVDGQEVKHSSIDARFNASEEKIAKNSQTSNNETKSLINDLVEKQNVSSQQIKELDQGNQGLLEKLLNLEKNLGDGFSTLEATDKNIGENVNSLNKDLAALKEDVGLKMKGINDNSDGIAERVSSLDGDFKSNLEKVVRLEESMHIQIENTKKIENERQTDALRAKEEIELMNAANSKSFATFQTQISEKVHIIEGNLKSLEDSSSQAALNLGNGFDDKLKVMKNEVDGKIDVNAQQIKELDMGNQGLLEKLLDLEKNLGGNSNSIANLEDQFAKKISTVQDELKSIEKSSTESANNLESGLSEKFKVMKDDVDKMIEKSSQLLDSQATDLEKKIKANTDNIKNLEDSLDGLRSTVDGQEVKHSSIDAKFNEFKIQINERFNASEEKIAKNSQTNNNETKSLINDLVEKQNVSSQQIKELDQGNQGLLEKLLNLEKNLGDGFSTLE